MKPTKEGNPMFGVDVKQTTLAGATVKVRIPMEEAKFADGRRQPLYFPEDHPRAGVFKGMAILLQKRGPEFKCAPPKLTCCCRRLLYNQPDFRDVETILEKHSRENGCRVIYLPKFHCDLNPIEQCWGAAKREYRMCPHSSSEADLEKNVLAALDSISLLTIRRYALCCM